MRARVLSLIVAVALGLLGPAAAPATASVPAARTCTGVWVVVDGTATGGPSASRCATDHDTGTAALRSAGFAVGQRSGMICSIDERPASCAISATAYWSYWHATRNPDGSYGTWTYSTLGADSYQPQRGDAEGWAFGAGDPPALGPDGQRASVTATAVASPTASASAAPIPAPVPEQGSPAGLLLTLGLLLAGALALGGWWWTRRRG